MRILGLKCLLVFAFSVVLVSGGMGQTSIPDELLKNSIKDQIRYIENRTAIYENYRAIREDMFQKINRNILDTLSASKKIAASLNLTISSMNTQNDSLTTALATTKLSLEKMTDSKNSIRVLGMEINKGIYNTIMWIIVLGLLFILGFGFLIFKRVISVNISTGKELKDLRKEFEDYRQSARIAREKMSMDHFKEIQKMKGI